MQVIEIREKVLGSDHTKTLSIIAWPTLAYQNQGPWKEAKKNIAGASARKRKDEYGLFDAEIQMNCSTAWTCSIEPTYNATKTMGRGLKGAD